jgi:N-acetylmuramoyl-L-alanine amidase
MSLLQRSRSLIFNTVLLRLVLCVCLMLVSSGTLCAQEGELTAERYEGLRAQYRSLVINDPGITEISLWKETRATFEKELASADLQNDRVYTPRILYLLGRLNEQLYTRGKDSGAGIRAERLFERIVRDFRGDDLADDALLSLSRMYHRDQRYQDERRVLKKIIDEYPSGSAVSHARKALEALKSVEAPRNDSETSGYVFEEEFTLPKDDLPADQGTGKISSLEKKYPVVVIDPGHGGSEDGAHGPDGIKEKEIVLAISKMLQSRFHADTKVRVYLTREGDEDLPLQERTRIANELGADLFVSVHANASPYKTRKGIETYYLDNTDDKSSLRLAERENLAGNISQKSLSFIISDFIQGIKMDDSITAAHLIQSNLVGELQHYYDSVKDLGVKKAPFYVLVGAHMPCILVEVSFIDHPVEGRRLKTERYQRVVADGIYNGILSYLSKKGRI